MKKLSKLDFNIETLVTFFSNTEQKEGLYVCKNCGYKIFLENKKILPICARCGCDVFTKE